MTKQAIKILLIILILLIVIVITYMFLFSKRSKLNSKLQELERLGFPVRSIIDKTDENIFPDQKIFLIDDSLVFIERFGFSDDYSFHHVLLDKDQKEPCFFTDSMVGPKMQCSDASKKIIFETIIKNLDKENLGLTDHKVELIYSTKFEIEKFKKSKGK